jgi:fumarylacetoacetase
VTPEALAPFRVAQATRPDGDPKPLAHLWGEADQQHGALDIVVEALLSTAQMRAGGLSPQRLSRANTTDLYWTVAQMVTHHASGGCNLRPGDLFGSGTISGPCINGFGSMNELSISGTRTFSLPSGETRMFLEDGDEVTFTGRCRRDGFAALGLGTCIVRVRG